MSIPSEFFKPFQPYPDMVAPEQVREARDVIGALLEVDPESIPEGVALTGRLRGVARAMSRVALTRDLVDMGGLALQPDFNPEIMPRMETKNVLRKFENPVTKLGRVFVVQPNIVEGTMLGVYDITKRKEQALYGAFVPSDYMIDGLLGEEPCFWYNRNVYSYDDRGDGSSDIALPFNNRFYDEGDAAKYLKVVQELSAELLAATDS